MHDTAARRRPHVATVLLTSVAAALALLLGSCGGGQGPELGDAPAASPTQTQPTADAEATSAPESTPAEATPTTSPTAGPGTPQPTATPAEISGAPAFTGASKLSTAGLDEVFFGDTVEQAAERVGTTWLGLPDAGTEPDCYTIQAAGEPRGVVFTVWSNRIERVDITTEIITTLSGAGVGSTPADLEALFGSKLETTAIEGGDDIAFVPESTTDAGHRIIWTTDGTSVVSMRAGRVGVVEPASPCA